jgi:hypothetical protein
MQIDHAEYFDLCWAASTAVRVDDGLGDVAYLDMAVFGRGVPAVTRAARGDGRSAGPPSRSPPDLLPPGQSVLQLCDLRLQLRPPGSWPPDSRRLSQPLLATAARPCVASMTSRPQTQGGDRSEPKSLVAVGRGIGPAACLLSYGTWAAAILGPARHPACDIPNRLLRHALTEAAWPVVRSARPPAGI